MGMHWKDDVIYDEIRNQTATAAVVKGQVEVRQDVAAFWIAAQAAGRIGGLIYRCRQVRADKKVGTGEAFLAGDRVYYYPTLDQVSPNAAGTAGVDYYFVGWAKDDAAASATDVLINYDGTRYDQNF